MLYVRMQREPDEPWWKQCRVCERLFFWLIIPFLLAAVLLGWLWARFGHADEQGFEGGTNTQTVPQAEPSVTEIYPKQAELGIQLEPGHWRCRKSDSDEIVFEHIEDGAPTEIILHCTNCVCQNEK